MSGEGKGRVGLVGAWASEVGVLEGPRAGGSSKFRKALVTSRSRGSKASPKSESSPLAPRPHSLMTLVPCFLGSPSGRVLGLQLSAS